MSGIIIRNEFLQDVLYENEDTYAIKSHLKVFPNSEKREMAGTFISRV